MTDEPQSALPSCRAPRFELSQISCRDECRNHPTEDRKGYPSLGLLQTLAAASERLAGMLTWYDVLGVLPGASPMQVQSAYQERARLLDPRMLNGAPSKVLKAADAARVTVGEAWHILQD